MADELDIFGTESAAGKEEIERMMHQLQCIVDADLSMAFDDDGAQISPKLWPESLKNAATRITPGANGLSIMLADKGRAADMLAKLKGLYKDEQVNENPLEKALSAIPRDELLVIAKQLKHLMKEPKPA